MTIQDGLWFDPAKLFIGGGWRAGGGGETIPVENPSTGEVIAAIARGTAEDVDAAVAAAQAALDGEWGAMTATERGRILTVIDCNPHQVGARFCKRMHLGHRGINGLRCRRGHTLNRNRMARTDRNRSDAYRAGWISTNIHVMKGPRGFTSPLTILFRSAGSIPQKPSL